MQRSFLFILSLFIIFYSPFSAANLRLITWKGTYYGAIPNHPGVSFAYCREHTPGSFVHVVKKPISRKFVTNRGITLDHGTFHVKNSHGIYLISGEFDASRITKNHPWKDHVYFNLFKLSEAGITRGYWYSDKCKGFYVGEAISNKNHK